MKSSSDVSSSNAPVEEMYALASKYEKMADADFLRKCEADSEGPGLDGDRDEEDDGRVGSNCASTEVGANGVGIALGDDVSKADRVSWIKTNT